MKILSLHGYGSKPHQDRIDIMSKYGEVTAPHLFYEKDGDIVIWPLAQKLQPDCIVGHSHGGMLAHHITFDGRITPKIPILLFNPALGRVRHKPLSVNPNTFMVIGEEDDVIPPNVQVGFAKQQFGDAWRDKVHMVPGLGHRVPPDIFQKYTDLFFKQYFPDAL